MRTSQAFITFFIFLFVETISIGQQYTQYTEKDGLASDFVYRAIQDKEGFMWFLTNKGISKFDGNSFRNYTVDDGLSSNDIWKMRVTQDKKVWYFTRSDALGYILKDSVYSFPSENGEMMNPNGVINQSINTISFVNQGVLYQLKDSVWVEKKVRSGNYPIVNKPLLVTIEFDKTPWLMDTNGRKIHAIKYSGFPHMNQLNDSLFVYNDDAHYTIVNLNTYNSISGSLNKYKPEPQLVSSFIAQWNNDGLQFSENNWLINFSDSLTIENAYPIPRHLQATHTIMDKDGFIWACTSYNGVYKLPKGYNEIVSLFEGKNISLIKSINNKVYFAVEGLGVYTFNGDPPKLILNETRKLNDIQLISSQLYFSFQDLLVVEENDRYTSYPNIKGNNISKHYIRFNNTLFSEGYNGIVSGPEISQVEKVYGDHRTYQGIFTQNDSLFSFNYRNLLYYEASRDAFVNYDEQKILKKYLTHDQTEGVTYIGTEGDGLYIFENGNLLKVIDNDEYIINTIFIEEKHSIWAISEGKLLRYYVDDSNQFVIKAYANINGFPTQNLTSIFVEGDRLFLGSTTGITILNKNSVVQTPSFSPYIKSIFTNNKRVRDSVITYRYQSNNSIKVNFGAIDFFDADPLIFQYKLSPMQHDWTTTHSGEVNLYDLKPDNYKLLLKVSQNTTEKFLTLPLSITPLWWQKASAKYAFALASIALLGFVLYEIRKREMKKKLAHLTTQKKMAEYQLHALRSQMNPHFVFNSLAAIQYYINDNDFITSEKYLVKFSRLIRRFFELSQEQKISISEEIDLLTNYLDIEKLRFKDKLSYSFTIDPSLNASQLFLPTMLLQPVVENAVNHGIFNKEGKGSVQIIFSPKHDNQLIVEIVDDGVGFARTIKKKNKKKTSSTVVQKRLMVLNASQEWSITYQTSEAFPELDDKGNRSVFTIKQNL